MYEERIIPSNNIETALGGTLRGMNEIIPASKVKLAELVGIS